MGFLKRIFSIGRKNKKQKKPHITHNVSLPESLPDRPISVIQEGDEDHEEAIGRLLRSSSQRYAVVAEVDYTKMPPMPHPINSVVNPPNASTVSLASSTLGSRPTYNVTLLHRHGSGESQFNTKDAETPRVQKYTETHLNANDSRVLRLRSDPSVASLVSLYDEHGRLPEAAFSNSPPSSPKTERAQCKRSGSTLRQLLGAPTTSSSLNSRSSDMSGEEGDISWAERFLAETDGNSSHSSLPLPTPISERAAFLGDISVNSMLSTGTMDNPAISSMDVELSISTDASEVFGESFRQGINGPHKTGDPGTPQRASVVFDFITKKRQSKFVEDDERPLPDLPSAFSSPSSQGAHSNNDHLGSHFSEDSCESAFARERISAIPIPSDTLRKSHHDSDQQQIDVVTYKFSHDAPQDIKRFSFNVETSTPVEERERTMIDVVPQTPQTTLPEISTPQDASKRPVKVIMSGPTKVIVTAPTPSSVYHGSANRIPRGPRSLSSKRRTSGSQRTHRRSAQVERSNTGGHTFTAIPVSTHQRPSHRRASSSRSIMAADENTENQQPSHAREATKDRAKEKRIRESTIPENYISRPYRSGSITNLGVKAEVPLTPLRSQDTNASSKSSRPSFRTVVNHQTFQPPASIKLHQVVSSDRATGKSTVGDLRQQRSKAREMEREKSSLYAMKKRLSGSSSNLLGSMGF